MQEHDVLIVGGGLVGNTLAVLLSQQFNVGIVEAQQALALDLTKFDLRNFAFTRASEKILRHAQVWDKLPAQRISAFRNMYVWDGASDGRIHFDCATLHEPLLGYIIEQNILQNALKQRLAEFTSICYYQPLRVIGFKLSDDVMQVSLSNGELIRTKLLVAADGANSHIRQLAGIAYNMHDYAQQAIVANVKTSYPHQATAWQRFLPTGPLAFLPLADEHWSSIVWSLDSPAALEIMQLSDAEFMTKLGVAFEHKLGAITEVQNRASFNLQTRIVQNYVQSRLALIGDAAHTIHPLAGQGVNLGLLDAASLATVLMAASNQDFGQHSVLRRYERWRKGHNLLMASTMYGFKQLFAQTNPAIILARQLGLNLTDAQPMAKKLIIRHAMGLAGDLPQMAR
jgi:2-polyprenylphenol 6-hydroxylase